MNEGVAIAFALIAAVVTLIGVVLFKEMRTHRFWRELVASNDLEAIRGLLGGEIEHWRAMRPPKGISATVWAGVQGMELLGADAASVQVSTSAAPEFRLINGRQTQVATALDTALATAMRLVEMIFYDVPDYRPATVRVDVYTTFHDEQGAAVARPILSVRADRAAALSIDWDEPDARTIALHFDTLYELSPTGEPQPIDLPPNDLPAAESGAAGVAPGAQDEEEGASVSGESVSGEAVSEDRPGGLR